MRLLRDHHNTPTDKQSGFTLIEMLVVAPLVLIVIAGLVSAMVAMIGDSLVASSRADAAYNIQDTLSQIEQDSRVATSFMGTFSYLQSPQGRNGATSPFSYSSNNDLILTQQATSSSPYSTDRQLIYYANQPADCGGDTSGNRTLFNRVVYFLLTNSDGSKSLWRRTILNPWNRNATPDGNTVCSTPWQRSSCPVGSTVSNTPGATCQSIDQKMLDNVTSFVPTFYTSSGSITSDPTQANTVGVSITVSKNVSGSTISQTSVVRASRRNDVPPTPVPTAPTISLYNPGVNAYNNPILTSVQWSAPNAYTYIVSTQVGAGAWSTPTTTSNTNISISSPPHSTINVKVTAVNDSGQSTATTASFTSDLFTDANLAGNWTCYSGTTYPCPSFTRTTAGVVVLRGLVKNGTGTITTLPAGFRPDKHLILPALSTGNAPARIDVNTDGTVSWVGGGGNSWISLDNIRFLSSDFDSSLTWTTPTYYCPSGCTTAWRDYTGGGGYGSVQFTKDSTGRGYVYGLMSYPAPNPPPNYSNMFSVPAGYQPSDADIYPDVINNTSVYASFGIFSTVSQFRTAPDTGSWKSVAAIYYPNNGSASWQAASLGNSWVNYGSSYAPAQYTRGSDYLVTLHGLIKSGSTTYQNVLFTLPAGYRPSQELLFEVSGYLSPSEVSARIDIQPDGDVVLMSSNGTIANNYLSLAGITFYAEQ